MRKEDTAGPETTYTDFTGGAVHEAVTWEQYRKRRDLRVKDGDDSRLYDKTSKCEIDGQLAFSQVVIEHDGKHYVVIHPEKDLGQLMGKKIIDEGLISTLIEMANEMPVGPERGLN